MISGGVTNDKSVELVERHVEGLAGSRQSYMVEYAIASRQFIEQELVRVLQDRVRHFTITIEQSGMNMSVKVLANSETGKYIYYGTSPHNIDAKSGAALSSGSNRFMQSHHPGTKGMKDKIDDAVVRGMADAKLAMGSLRQRG